MQLRHLISALALAVLPALANDSPEVRLDFFRDVDIFAWPLSAAKPQPFVTVAYNYQNATIKKYTPLKIPLEEETVRIGFHVPNSGAWAGVATSASNFAADQFQRIRLLVGENAEIYHLTFTAASSGDASQDAQTLSAKDRLTVDVVEIAKGQAPLLNKPIVVSQDGQVEGKEPEKTFLQK